MNSSNGILKVLTILVLVGIAACKHDVPTPAGNGNGSGNDSDSVATGIPCNPDSVYFEAQVLPILVANCTQSGCHNTDDAAEGVVLDSYSNVMSTGGIDISNPANSEIYRYIIKTGPNRMPPPGYTALTQTQKDIILKWIQQGAQDLHCQDLTCDSTNVTYTGTIQTIIQNKCLGCHQGAGAGAGISLTNYSEVVTAAQDPSFMGSIRFNGLYSNMPKGCSKLSDCEIAKVNNWINNGMPQ